MIPTLLYRLYAILFIGSLFFVSCGSDDSEEIITKVEGIEITNFSFLKIKNPSLNFDVNLEKINDKIINIIILWSKKIYSMMIIIIRHIEKIKIRKSI